MPFAVTEIGSIKSNSGKLFNSPSAISSSSINDENVDGLRAKSAGIKQGPKSSPARLKWFKRNSKTDLHSGIISPQSGEQHPLSPRETSPTPLPASPDPVDRASSPENFFSFTTSEDVNIWGDDFTSILRKNTIRKLSLISEENKEATPIQEADNTENIGVAYVAEERKSKLIDNKVTHTPGSSMGTITLAQRGRRATSPPSLQEYMKKTGGLGTLMESPIRPRAKTEDDFLGPNKTSSLGRPSSYEADSLSRVVVLEQEIEELKAARWRAPSIKETIDRILLGKAYCLEWFKSPVEKRALLDAAIDSNDGNCIIAILLFIRKTVNQPILLGMLKKRPAAIRHYASFLKQIGGTTELTNLYLRLGEKQRLADIKLQQCEAELNPGERYNKIRDTHVYFTSSPELKADAKHIEEYARLVNQQRMIEDMEGYGGATTLRPGTVLFRSMVTTLLYCCRYHRNKPETNTASPVALRRQFNIAEKQYFQMCLLALCIDEDWSALEELVTTKGFMGIGKKKKSPIGFERIVKTIARKSHKPPAHILKKYLVEVDDMELRLQLSTEVGVFDIGLECLRQLKDRERLKSFINYIPVNKHYEYRPKIDSLLKNSHIKWK